MKILFILKKEPDENITTIMAESAKKAEIIAVDIREDQDYNELVDHIETCDQVISW